MKDLLKIFNFSYVYAFLGEATLGLTFLLYILIARVLNPEQYGIFAAAVALGGILAFFIQFGLPTLLAREVAANPEEGAKLTIPFIFLEGILSLPVFAILLPISQLLGFQGVGILVSFLVLSSEIFRSAKQTLRAVFRGMEQFRAETISVALERSITVLIACTVLLISKNLLLVVATIVLVRAFDVVLLSSYLSRRLQIWTPTNIGSFYQYVKTALPFALTGVLWILYYQVDILMLKGLSSDAEVGFYSASYRIIEIFSALPRVIFYVSFTKFVKCHTSEPGRLTAEVGKSINLLLVGFLPILIVAGFCQPFLIETLYGKEYLPSLSSLSILLTSLGIKIFGTLVEYFFQATGREKVLPPLLFGSVVMNILVNAWLIPSFGSMGAALATLLSEIFLAILGWASILRGMHRQMGQVILPIAALSLLAAASPSLILWGLETSVGVGILIVSLGIVIALMHWRFPTPLKVSSKE